MQSESSIPPSGVDGKGSGSTPIAIVKIDGTKSGPQLELSNFLSDIEDLIKATTSLTGEDLARARARLAERVTRARQSLEALSGAIVHQARKTAAETNDYVHKQPWQAVGIAATVGMIFGFVFGRRR